MQGNSINVSSASWVAKTAPLYISRSYFLLTNENFFTTFFISVTKYVTLNFSSNKYIHLHVYVMKNNKYNTTIHKNLN